MPPQISRHVGHFLVEPGPPREVVLARNIFFGPRAKKFAFTWKKNQAGRAKSNGPRAHFWECRTQSECRA